MTKIKDLKCSKNSTVKYDGILKHWWKKEFEKFIPLENILNSMHMTGSPKVH